MPPPRTACARRSHLPLSLLLELLANWVELEAVEPMRELGRMLVFAGAALALVNSRFICSICLHRSDSQHALGHVNGGFAGVQRDTYRHG